MICWDCREAILESERKAVRFCAGCDLPLHAECVMVGPREADYCEACLRKEAQLFHLAMKQKGKA